MRHNIENSTGKDYFHTPVLLRQIQDLIDSSPFKGEGYLVDCTIGEGGHSEFFLKNYSGLNIIAFDRDDAILEIARKRLNSFKDRIVYINDNFSEIPEYLDKNEFRINYFLYDFGISSYHLEKSERGFALRGDEFLDMRLDRDLKHDAEFIVNNYKEKRLADIIYEYGEERWARRIAGVICTKRKEKPVKTTGELSGIVLSAIPKKYRVKNIHPATRVFQALRIEVNDELKAIEKSLNCAYRYLAPGGRIIAISFHSLEDRIVKNRFRRLARGCTCNDEMNYCQCTGEPQVRILTKKPVTPAKDEISENKRSRSSKLRACEKI